MSEGPARVGPLGALQAFGDLLGLNAQLKAVRIPMGNDGDLLASDTGAAGGTSAAPAAILTLGCTFPYGGSLKTIGNYYEAHGVHDSGEAPALDYMSLIASPIGGKIAALGWSSQSADATTVLQLVIPGPVVIGTVTLTGPSGVALWTPVGPGLTVAMGALLAVEYAAGQMPEKSTVTLAMEK